MDENYHSGMNILQFYLEICANELRKTSITEDKFKSALDAVSCTSLESSQISLNFGAPQNRAAYIYRFHPCLTWSLENYMKRVLAECSEVKDKVKKLLDNSNIKLCCIGGDVGADFIGFLSAISDYTIKPAFKSVTIVTKSVNWQSTFNSMVANLKSGILNPVHEHVLGNKFVTTFEGCDLSKHVSSKILHKIKEANTLLITKFFPSDTLEDNKLEAVMEGMLSAVSPGSLIFFIDHSSGFSTMLRAIQYTRQDMLFGPLQVQYRFPYLEDIFKGLFGYFPEMSSRTYFMVWEKNSNDTSRDASLTSNSVEPNEPIIAVKTSGCSVSNSLHDSNNSLSKKKLSDELVSLGGPKISPSVTVADIICVSAPTNGLVSGNNVSSGANDSVSVIVGGIAGTVNIPKDNQELLNASSPTSRVQNMCHCTDNNGSQNKIPLGTFSGQEKCHVSASSPSGGGSDSSGSDCGKFAEYPPSNDTSRTNHTAHRSQNECSGSHHISPSNKIEGEQPSDLVKTPRRRKRGRGGRKSQIKDKAENGNYHTERQNTSGVTSQVPPSKLSTSYNAKALNNSSLDTPVRPNSYSSANKMCQTTDAQKIPCDVITIDKSGTVPVNSGKNTASKSPVCCPSKAVPRETVCMQRSKTYEAVGSQSTGVNMVEKVNLKDNKQKWRSHYTKFTQTEIEEYIPKLGDSAQRCLLELTRRVDALTSVVEELVLSQRQGRCSCTNCYRSTPVARSSDTYFGGRSVNPSLVLPISNLTESQVSQVLSLVLSQALHPKNHTQ